MGFFMEIWAYYKARKKLWLIPLIVMFALVGMLTVLTQGSAVAPFIYTVF